ncbi:hypothetical protein Tco_0704133 [Tanacetum coccineum]|uniref:Reverse transcriptase n=1 Tax=Tanacetum coccineum TaxID=301880 RepID=A0ABQ4Y2Q0_9ASTR
MLQRCERHHLVLSWEKCPLYVRKNSPWAHKLLIPGFEVLSKIVSGDLLLQEFDVVSVNKKGTEIKPQTTYLDLENPPQSELRESNITEIFPLEYTWEVTYRDSTVPITQLKRSSIQDFISPRSTRMPTTLSPDVTFVNVKAKFRNVMRCLKTLSKFANLLTCGALILWAIPSSRGTINTVPLIIYQNGLEQKRSPPMTHELFANFLNLSSPDSVPLMQS